VILYTQQDFVSEVKRLTDGRGADLIIDGVGRARSPATWRQQRSTAILFFSALPAALRIPLSRTSSGEVHQTIGGSLETILRHVRTWPPLKGGPGRDQAAVAEAAHRPCPALAEAGNAHRMLEGRQTMARSC